jgi:arylsulfatase A-like enzyme
MMRSSSPRPLGASLIAGALTGLVDMLLSLATNPDPALASYRLGYALGPLLAGVAVGLVVGLPSGWLAGRLRLRRATPGGIAAGAVMAVWALSVLVDVGRGGRGWTAAVVVGVVATVGAVALGRLAVEVAAALERLGAGLRRAVWIAATVTGLAAVAAVVPSALSTFAAGTGPCASGPPPPGPNVLLVTVDALRADSAEAMQSYRRLAARGVEFRRHVTLSPWTLPSVASLMTGMGPDEHGAGLALSSRSLIAKTPLPAGVQTLAHVLGVRGYRTHAEVTNPFLTARYGMDAGFCSFDNVSMAGEAARGLAQTVPLRFARALLPGALPSDRADVVRERAERWIAAAGDRPFFLWVHFLDPHAPYGDRAGEPTSLTLDLMAFQRRALVEAPFRSIALLRAGEFRPSAAERRRIFGLYQEDVDFTDRQLARLLDFLDTRGLTARTAVVFTADHGEEFWEHGGVEHGRTLYDEVLRVPLVVVPAGGRSPAVRSELTSVTDVAPTILGLAGVETTGWSGVDLLARPAPDDRTLALGNLLFGEEWTGVRTADAKYMRSESGEERLFDLRRDPGERTNAVGAMGETLARLRPLARPMPEPGAAVALRGAGRADAGR